MDRKRAEAKAPVDISRYDGLPFPQDYELAVAINNRMNVGEPEAAFGLIKQYRERLLHHPESQEAARKIK
jgi:hypothetical protein